MKVHDRQKASRLAELDALRGIAASTVALVHFTHFTHDHWQVGRIPFRLEGGWAVLLFFVISGFVIYMTIERSASAMDFVVSRIARIYPAYVVAVVTTFVIVSTCKLPGRETTLPQMLVNLTMIQAWLNIPFVDSVYWTLCAEFSFYIWMVILYVLGGTRHIIAISIGALTVSVVSVLLEAGGVVAIPEIWRLTLLLRFSPFFAAGLMFYRIWSRRHETSDPRGLKSEHIVIAMSVLAYLVQFLCVVRDRASLGVVILIFLLFYLVVNERARWLGLRPLVSLGVISYPLYLLHNNIGCIVIRESVFRGADPRLGIFFAMTVAIALATIVSVLVERPGRRFIRSSWQRYLEAKKSPCIVVAPGA